MKKTAGFTLVEMLIVIAIVGILTRIAISSYQDSVNKSRRSEAITALLQGAQQLERFYSANGSYLSGGSLAAVFQIQVPATGTAYYNIAVSSTAPTATTYTLQATRAGVMSTDKCGDFQINQAGAHTLAAGTNTYALDQCWRR